MPLYCGITQYQIYLYYVFNIFSFSYWKIVNPVPGFQHHFCLFLFFTNFFHSLLSLLRLILFPHFSLTISFYWVIWCLLKYLLLLVLPPAYFVFKLFLYFMYSLSISLSLCVSHSLYLSISFFLLSQWAESQFNKLKQREREREVFRLKLGFWKT